MSNDLAIEKFFFHLRRACWNEEASTMRVPNTNLTMFCLEPAQTKLPSFPIIQPRVRHKRKVVTFVDPDMLLTMNTNLSEIQHPRQHTHDKLQLVITWLHLYG